jgi:hypothetical protein
MKGGKAEQGRAGGRGKREPSMREQIEASGETEVSAVREALRTDLTDHRFLGREFLTWLIFYADDDGEDGAGGKFAATEEADAFRVIIGERAVLKALGDGSGEITARGPATGQVADVRYAIAGGLTVREIDVLFERGDRIWQAAVSAESFDLKRVKLPELLSEEDSERAAERLQLTDDLDAMLRAAYRTFLTVRLDAAWSKDWVPRLRAWLARSILEEKFLESEQAESGRAGRRPRRAMN